MKIRRIAQRIRPLGAELDVYKCLSCGTTTCVNADGETFRQPAPLGCQKCPGQPDMQAGRYVIKSSARQTP